MLFLLKFTSGGLEASSWIFAEDYFTVPRVYAQSQQCMSAPGRPEK
jgi:hypothetical protein